MIWIFQIFCLTLCKSGWKTDRIRAICENPLTVSNSTVPAFLPPNFLSKTAVQGMFSLIQTCLSNCKGFQQR
nr:MAG TPA: hypothetical protein [Caudoviricetes sp.]